LAGEHLAHDLDRDSAVEVHVAGTKNRAHASGTVNTLYAVPSIQERASLDGTAVLNLEGAELTMGHA
jgi:hypothetical protein